MKKLINIIIFSFALCFSAQAQTQIRCTDTDMVILDSLFKTVHEPSTVAVGRFFIGTPYIAHTLECENEVLTINLRELDCTTFLENVVVITSLMREGKKDFYSYVERIKNFRYRNGKVEGYGSRLHYFSDWIVTNEARGFVHDVTKEIGGEVYTNPVSFMTKNRDKYPRLADQKTYETIVESEKNLNSHTHYYIPKAKVSALEKNIKSGDLIAITCATQGLDIAHVGFAIKQDDGRIHFMHAPMAGAKVTISEKPLHDYLAASKRFTGIMVVKMIEK